MEGYSGRSPQITDQVFKHQPFWAGGYMFKHIESLEARRLFAIVNPTVTFSNGVLTVKGGTQSDFIGLIETASSPTASTVQLQVDTPSRGYSFSNTYINVTAINIYATGGADSINHVGDQIHPKIYGGGGNDIIKVSDLGTGSSYIDAG